MCGIAGILNFDGAPVDAAVLKRMTDAIAHRGPDGEGFYAGEGVGLGHRRLAIIDLSDAAAQPMSDSEGRRFIVYNGEVYNFAEIRDELVSLGHVFKSRTDSEVVLHAYIEWGEKSLEKFNGMFAFAVWDKVERELFIARDRCGIKPLYYALRGGTFVFGSEVKAIARHPDCPTALDRKALLEYFTFQNFFTDRTLFAGVKLFPSGSHLRLKESASGGAPGALNFTRYWDFHFEDPANPADDEEYAEELDRLFTQAVTRQLVSDVDVGSYLSGGLDSGSITAIAATHLPYIKTFTCGFDLNSASGLEVAFDERKKAELMSYLFKTEHYEMVLKAGDMERVMPRLAWHIEESRVGQSYPNFYVSQLAAKFVKVVLSGAGGDELFGGYPWRYYRAVVNDDFEHYIDKYYLFWQRLIPNTAIKKVFSPIWPDVQDVWTRDIFRDVFLERENEIATPEDYINHSLYFEAKTFLAGLLIIEDKLSMAHGLETRVPFLDNDLVDFAMKVPVRLKLGNLKKVVDLNENVPGKKTARYFKKTRDGKLLLRRVMARHTPKEVVRQVKQGFSAPDASWFKGESIDYVRETLFGGEARLYEYLDRSAVRELVEEHLEGKINRRLFIWSLLSFEWWLKTFLG